MTFNRNPNIFIQENAFENVVCEMASICLGLNVLIVFRISSYHRDNFVICQQTSDVTPKDTVNTLCPVKPYGEIYMSWHWLRQWPVAWWHQAITWTIVDWSSVKSNDIRKRAISLEILQSWITKIILEITYLKLMQINPIRLLPTPVQHNKVLATWIILGMYYAVHRWKPSEIEAVG